MFDVSLNPCSPTCDFNNVSAIVSIYPPRCAGAMPSLLRASICARPL